jgi:hypothetical protein
MPALMPHKKYPLDLEHNTEALAKHLLSNNPTFDQM